MSEIRRDANGNLQIWNGGAWQTLGKIAASDMSYYDASKYQPQLSMNMGDNTPIQQAVDVTSAWNFNDADTAAKYGLGDMSVTSNNYRQENVTPDSWELLLKNADKSGGRIVYRKVGDEWVPTYEGDVNWNSNADSAGAAALGVGKVLAAPLMQYGMQELGLVGQGTAPTFGNAEFGGDVFASGAGSFGSAAGNAATNVGNALQYGDLGLESIWNPELATQSAQLSQYGLSGADALSAFGGGLSAVPGVTTELFPFGASGMGGMGLGAGSASGVTELLDKGLDFIKSNPSLLKAAMPLVGGLLAKGTEGEQQSSAPTAQGGPVTTPTMYGSGTNATGLLGGQNWGAMGPTETERRMRMQYLPGLLGAGPWSV